MSEALVVREPEDLGGLSLDELGSTATQEFDLGCHGAVAAVEHWIRCGEALNEVKSRLQRGEWQTWLDLNWGERSQTKAYVCMRFARNRDLVGDGKAQHIDAGIRIIRAANKPQEIDFAYSRGDEIEEARRLFAEGLNCAEIGRRLGKHQSQVWSWCHPGKAREIRRRAYAKRRAAKLALQQKQRDQAMKRAGSDLNEVYTLVLKCLGIASRAEEKAEETEKRKAIAAVIHQLHKTEDALVRASKTV